MFKQVILVRKDLRLPQGKLGAQTAHASVDAVLKADAQLVRQWRNQGMMKVVLKVTSLEELYMYVQQAKDVGIVTGVITDAGKTVVEPGTVTCAALGPALEEDIDRITGNVALY